MDPQWVLNLRLALIRAAACLVPQLHWHRRLQLVSYPSEQRHDSVEEKERCLARATDLVERLLVLMMAGNGVTGQEYLEDDIGK